MSPRISMFVVALLLLVPPAFAVDGVLEINQTCAVQAGCFSGDTPGFPVTIDGSAGFSYRLTSHLTIPDENTDGIQISTSDVGIDLNNFAIIRSGCEGVTTDCTPASGTGSGVETDTSFNRGLSVKNGSITGMGRNGVFLGGQAEVTNLRVRWNRIAGILVTGGSNVVGNTAYQNGGNGIHAGSGSNVSRNTTYQNEGIGIRTEGGTTISGNTVYENGSEGINTVFASSITGNTAFGNGGDGIFAGGGSTISGNTTRFNGNDGIQCGIGCSIIGNTSYHNGDLNDPGTDDGIECSAGCIVQENGVRRNEGYGLRLGEDSAYMENVVTSNVTGTITGQGIGNNLGSNYCTGGIVSACP